MNNPTSDVVFARPDRRLQPERRRRHKHIDFGDRRLSQRRQLFRDAFLWEHNKRPHQPF